MCIRDSITLMPSSLCRYYLFYYPLSCAFLGILFNCLWVTVAFTLTWYKLGLELLDGTQVKAVTSKDEASGERAGEQEVCPTEAKDPVETVGELGPAEEEKEERALTPPISKYLKTVLRNRKCPKIHEDSTKKYLKMVLRNT